MMGKFVLRWAVAALIVGSSAFAFASTSRPEPNAFLNRKADTVTQLLQQIDSDPIVASRYERHFGKSKEELIQYFRGLHLAKLNADGTYMIYLVDDDGVIKAKPQRMKAGTRVFADNSGTPILKASCGNALVGGSNLISIAMSPGIGAAGTSIREVTAVNYDPPDFPTTAVAEVPPLPLAVQPVIPDQITTGKSNQGFAVPVFLAGIGGAGALLLGGGHGGAPVPEPASIIVMIGAVAAYKMRRRKK